MNKRLLVLVAAAAIGISSCKKKIEDPTDPLKLEYSNLSVEEHKKTLEKNGTDFLAAINTLPDEKFIKVLKHFIEIDGDVPTYTLPFSSLFEIYNGSQNGNIYDVFYPAIKPNTRDLSEFFAIYTWNFSRNKWDKSPSTTKLEINFPADANSKTNNAILSFVYTASGIIATVDGEKLKLPTSYTAKLTVDGKDEIKITSDHTYKANGNPTKADIKLVMGSFNMNVLVASDDKKATATMNFSKGTTTLMNLVKAEGNGNTDYNTIINADKVDGILDNANATFEIMNIRLVGMVDTKSIAAKYNALSNLSDEARNKKEVEIMNEYSTIYATYKNDNTIIAKVNLAAITESYTYNMWDGTKYVPYTYYYYSSDPRLIFKDNSAISLEAFTDTGFSKLITELENFGERFE